MFGFIKNLFGSSKNTETIVETAAKGIYNGLDALVFTDEEKAQYRAEQSAAVLEFAKVAYDQNSIRSITRRWLAFMVVAPAMLCFVLSMIMSLVHAFTGLEGAAIAGKDLFALFVEIGPWAIGILAFYFGGHLLSALRKP